MRWTVGRSVGGSIADDEIVDLNDEDDDPLLREHRDGVSPLPGEGGGGGRSEFYIIFLFKAPENYCESESDGR